MLKIRRLLDGKEELVFGGLLLALGIYVLANTANIRIPAGIAAIGPRFFPYLVGTLVVLTGIFVVIDVLRGRGGEEESSELTDPSLPINWRRTAGVVAVVLLHIALIDSAGWVIAAAVAFWGVSFALGSRHLIRDPLIAIVLALVVYEAFTRLLAIHLPAGILQGVL